MPQSLSERSMPIWEVDIGRERVEVQKFMWSNVGDSPVLSGRS